MPSARLIFALVATLHIAAPAAASAATRPKQCDGHARAAVLKTAKVIIYATRSDNDTTFRACARPAGAPVFLGRNIPDDDFYGSDATTAGLRAAGTYVAAVSSSGQASLSQCEKYQQPNCPQPRYWIRVIDTKTTRRVNVATTTVMRSVAVSSAGALAWLDTTSSTLFGTALRPRGAKALAVSPRDVDHGNVGLRSLKFTGRTLHWTRDGVRRSEAI